MAGISIIIITYNRANDTLELLQSIAVLKAADGLLEEIILVNNASTDDYGEVKDYVAAHPDMKIQLLTAPGNLGVAGGRNFAVKHCKGEWMLFLDDDVVMEDPEFLVRLEQAYTKSFLPDWPLGAMGCKVRYYENRQVQVNAFPHKNYALYKDRERFLTSYFVGCAHVISKQAWDAAGDYPADFFYGMEEYDLSYRLLQAGYCIGYDGSVEILHKESPLGRSPKPLQLSMMWVNKAKVAWKYLPVRYFITTSLLWAGFYLKKSGYNWAYFFVSWKKILAIPSTQPRNRLNKRVMSYLKAVGARRWF